MNSPEFVNQLNNFLAWSYAQSPSFGDMVKRVAIARSGSQFFGDASDDASNVSPSMTDDPSVTSISPSVAQTLPATQVVNDLNTLNEVVNGAANAFVNGTAAYYTAQAQLNNLKIAANAQQLGVPIVPFSSSMTPILVLGGAAILLVVVMGKK